MTIYTLVYIKKLVMRHSFKLNIHVKHQNALQRYIIIFGTQNFRVPTNIKIMICKQNDFEHLLLHKIWL